MNPYEILGVPSNATNAEIKTAYRKLVKQFHPDATGDENHEDRIRQINEAYDILSDSVRKQAYDRGPLFDLPTVEEDPREIYRREYIRKKEEGARLKKVKDREREANTLAREKVIYKIVRIINLPAFLFALVLVTDQFLPQNSYSEVPELGWQKRFGGGRSTRTGSYSQGELYSFMQTEHFVISVPDELHVGYDYYATKKQPINISVSPIFKVPMFVSYEIDGQHRTDEVRRTIYSQLIPWHYLLLVSSVFVVMRREHSMLAYALCFLPFLFLAIILLIMF